METECGRILKSSTANRNVFDETVGFVQFENCWNIISFFVISKFTQRMFVNVVDKTSDKHSADFQMGQKKTNSCKV